MHRRIVPLVAAAALLMPACSSSDETSAARPISTGSARQHLDALLSAWVAQQPAEEPAEGIGDCPLFDDVTFLASAPASYTPAPSQTLRTISGGVDKDGPTLVCTADTETDAGQDIVAVLPTSGTPFADQVSNFWPDAGDFTFETVTSFRGGDVHGFSFAVPYSDGTSEQHFASAWVNSDITIVLDTTSGIPDAAAASAWLIALLPEVISGLERATPENTLRNPSDSAPPEGSVRPASGTSDLDTAAATASVEIVTSLSSDFSGLSSGCPLGSPTELLASAPTDFWGSTNIGEVSDWINDGDPSIGCSIREGSASTLGRVRFIAQTTGTSQDNLAGFTGYPDVRGGQVLVACEETKCKVVWRDSNLTIVLYAESYSVNADMAVRFLSEAVPGIIDRLAALDVATVALSK